MFLRKRGWEGTRAMLDFLQCNLNLKTIFNVDNNAFSVLYISRILDSQRTPASVKYLGRYFTIVVCNTEVFEY